MQSDSLEYPKGASYQDQHLQGMVELQYLRLGSLISSGIDDLLFEGSQFWIANHTATND